MTSPDPRDVTARRLNQAFSPLHKEALGAAVGVVAGLLVGLATLAQVVAAPFDGVPLALLGQFFFGYTVSPSGAVIGFFWGGITGFVAGWFFAFMRNLTIALSVFALRTKAELAQTRDFLDHI